MRVRCASCRGLHGSAGMQGGLRRGACGAALLQCIVEARVARVGEGVQEGHALMPLPKLEGHRRSVFLLENSQVSGRVVPLANGRAFLLYEFMHVYTSARERVYTFARLRVNVSTQLHV
jgi:hypothetical protein